MGPRRTPAREVKRSATVSRAETLLLDLARALAADARGAPSPVDTLVQVADRYSPGSALARALLDAGLRAQDDEGLALALAWAREHVRLALEDLVQAALDRGDLPADPVQAGTLAWLLLAGFEALALEPGGAVADRVQALVAFVRGHRASGLSGAGLAPARPVSPPPILPVGKAASPLAVLPTARPASPLPVPPSARPARPPVSRGRRRAPSTEGPEASEA